MKRKSLMLFPTFLPLISCFASNDLNDLMDSFRVTNASFSKSDSAEVICEKNFFAFSNTDWDTVADLEHFGIDFNTDSLYFFAFNTGQANCCILRKRASAFIIDAGQNGDQRIDDMVNNKLKLVLKDSHIKGLFVTHNDADHCSFLKNENGVSKLFRYSMKNDQENQCEYFCKSSSIYTGEKSKEISNNATNGVLTHNIDGVRFDLFNVDSPCDFGKNASSLVVKITYLDKKILFTGDAEGKTFTSLYGQGENVFQQLKFLSLTHSLSDRAYVLLDTLLNYGYNEHDYGSLRLELSRRPNACYKLPVVSGGELPNEIREQLKDINIVVLPHHGTDTQKSQNWLAYFSGRKKIPIFIISSSPFVANKRPVKSTIDMVPSSSRGVPTHTVIYSNDDVVKQLLTTKPIYVTGAAHGGMYCFSLARDTLSIFDVCRRNDGALFRWIDLITEAILVKGYIMERDFNWMENFDESDSETFMWAVLNSASKCVKLDKSGICIVFSTHHYKKCNTNYVSTITNKQDILSKILDGKSTETCTSVRVQATKKDGCLLDLKIIFIDPTDIPDTN